VKFHTASRVSLDLKWIHDAERKSVLVEFLTKTCSSSNELSVFTFALYGIRARLLNVDDHVGGVELINIEVEKLINELSNRLGVFFLGHVKLLDHFQVLLKEGVCLIHAVHFFVDVLGGVVMSPTL
jgi:hypothetical protein